MADGEELLAFLAVMRRLRVECGWKRSQTHRSLSRYLLEETYETLEAIDTGSETGEWDHLREELGDLLLQVWFHAVIAEEHGEFTLDEVAADVTAKMVRRNPHVFDREPGSSAPDDPVSINEMWEAVKAAEKQRTTVLEGIPPELPALLYADKVLDRLSRSSPGRHTERATVDSDRMTSHDVIGERLLALVAEAHADGVDPEQALRDAVRRAVQPGTGP